MKLTELGYPVVSDEIHNSIFGKESIREMEPDDWRRADSLLSQFNISIPVDYPENLYDGPLPLPKLKAATLKQHYEKIAEEQVGDYVRAAEKFSRCVLPQVPAEKDFVIQPGWTRYEHYRDAEGRDRFKTEKVPYPLEDAFTFDTETFVKKGAYPIIGTAVSEKASYIWLASELINPTLPKEEWDEWDMIPVGKGKFIAGHNISYDRVRAQEGYDLSHTEPENFYFDTLSAHVGVSGLVSGQRWLYILKDKDPDKLTEDEQNQIKLDPKWLNKGTTNSLLKCYNFHVYEESTWFGEDGDKKPMTVEDKETRDIFVDAEYICEITSLMGKVVSYAINDALKTAELFQAIWPKYRDSTPSMVGLCGHYHLNGSIVPLVDNWDEWIEGVEKVFDEHNKEMTELCLKLLWNTYNTWEDIRKDEGLEKANEWANGDPWNSQLDWTVRTNKGKYADVPNWVRPFIKEPDLHIGVKSKLSHFLLKLKYKGSPLTFIRGCGWCYFDTEVEEMTKIPHPKGTGENVGGVLSKDFVDDMQSGRLSSDLPEAQRALDIANAVSYWTSVRKRVMGRITMLADNPHGEKCIVTLPEIFCHGTVTRRTVESLFVTMCSTKNWRIGTELKTRVKAPEGWKIVGADFDGQEMQIASIYSDKWEGGFIGCSPFGYNVLSGSKESGTDPHTSLARAILPDLYKGLVWDKKLGVCERVGDSLVPIADAKKKELSKARDLAKVVGFTVLYGGGVKAVQTYIRKVYPDKSEAEAKKFAETAISKKKGDFKYNVYSGGSDSGCFNYMEKIALHSKVSQLPCLGTKISTAIRKNVVGKDFKTGRVNWTIQSSGAEILSIILTTVHWLAREYKIPCRFILSIHDEVWFMTPDKYAEQFAAMFQIAHMYTWSLFQSQVGIPDLPLSRAYFSSVAIDDRVRKSPKEKTITLSNPSGETEPFGTEYSMTELSEIGAIKKLAARYKTIIDSAV